MTNQAPTILVIEDDVTIVELIRALLVEEGYRVRVATSGPQALAGEHPAPALVVLDMYVPGLSGSELADRLRASYGAELPILVISASNVDGEAHKLGAYEYLPKPFDLDKLLAAVRRGLDPHN